LWDGNSAFVCHAKYDADDAVVDDALAWRDLRQTLLLCEKASIDLSAKY
jgi:hypothetical protein